MLMAPRSLHPIHAADILIAETERYVDFRPVCRCGQISDRVRLPVPYRPHQRIEAWRSALEILRRHEHAAGVHETPAWATSTS